ncbi:MAG: transmembrane 220 family protein [Chitinophagales bacterium]
MNARIINIVLALFFFAFAAVQYNDPDGALWFFIYGIVGGISLLGVFKEYNRAMLLSMMILYFGGFMYLFPSVIEWITQHEFGELIESMKTDKPFIEKSRESLGLLLCFLAIGYHYYESKTARR